MSRKNNVSGSSLSPEVVDSVTGEVFPRFRSAYNHARPGRNYSSAVGEVSITKQEFKNECDINLLMKRYARNLDLFAFQASRAQFMDLSQMPGSYHESLNLVIAAQDAFDALPASARKRFDNDISVFLQAAAADPEAVFGPRGADGNLLPPKVPEVPSTPSTAQISAPAGPSDSATPKA